ncbi:guanylate-binding protein 1-like [Apodemus sylvaticus]|uniref:guanylate-binding protein 1-like n=1 Tax=Apodemus sylvaticus TaxID=10129 RepID=UPI002243C5B2|nr:guanylate-binding protein 1-like [Apodemus sylvaticus]
MAVALLAVHCLLSKDEIHLLHTYLDLRVAHHRSDIILMRWCRASVEILLSSTFVNNSTETINQQAMDQLLCVTELADLIKSKLSPNQSDKDDSANFLGFFHTFVWTLRDFFLELEVNGRSITPDEHLESSLVWRPGLKIVVENYVGAICSGEPPCMESGVLTLAQIENSSALQKAITYYEEKMSQKVHMFIVSLKDLLDQHRTCKSKATEVFMKNSFKDVDLKFQKKLGEQEKLLQDGFKNESKKLYEE